MHSKVISKIRCYSPNQKNTALRNYNYLYYIATREGVDLELLTKKLEGSPSDNITYLKYIHHRPRSNGLFGSMDTSDINKLCSEIKQVSRHQCIYRGILSLSEEDARELGYLSKSAWNDYLTLALPQVSEVLGIPASEMRWVAAFHRERGHPHVHYMLWSSNPTHIQVPFISVPQQHKCRELLAGRFTEKERRQLSLQKTQVRNVVLLKGKSHTETALNDLVADICRQPEYKTLSRINKDMLEQSSRELLELVASLPRTGSIKYAYLPPDTKAQVDRIVQNMLGKAEIKAEYDSYLNYCKNIAETYSPTRKEVKVAILKGKEDIDRRLANIVLKSAKELRKDKEFYYSLVNNRLPSYHHLLTRGITNDTIQSLKDISQAGDTQATYLLARIYDDPTTTYYNPNLAFHYYKDAADNGHANAQGILGCKYIWGKDTKPDKDKGREYLHRAQAQGNNFAKDVEDSYDSFRRERAIYTTASLMRSFLLGLCSANHVHQRSSVYKDFDKNNVKAKLEIAYRQTYEKREQ